MSGCPPRRDRSEFERMYIEHRDRLFAFFVYRTGDRALAEDLVGDVFERAYRARARFDPQRGSYTTWLYSIAVNRLRDHHRRTQIERSAIQRVAASEPLRFESPYDAVAERDLVMRALDVLNEREREIIALRFGGDLTAPQIGRVTEQPVATVEGRLFRALKKLAPVLEAEAPSAVVLELRR